MSTAAAIAHAPWIDCRRASQMTAANAMQVDAKAFAGVCCIQPSLDTTQRPTWTFVDVVDIVVDV